jgi:polysaccharide chain length determinant protein (PEP-CTERM system associated)
MSVPFEQVARVLSYEAFRHRRLIVGGIILINIVVIGLALAWPPTYQSSTTIFVEQKNIIQPLMQGTAVPTDVRDQARIARETVFSRKVMTQALEHVGWLKKDQTEIQQEKTIEAAKDRTKISNVGPNLIRIEHKDRDPERAYKITQKLAELFIAESLGSQANESQAAFEFIDKQVKEYHEKLMQAEEQLKEFRSKHVDARPGTEAEVSRRIDTLQATIERTTLELKEAKIKESSIEKQLSGEAEVSINVTRESQYIARIAELQGQLENLRLTYHDTYPDIVRIKHQIEDLKESVTSVRQQREEARKNPKTSNQTSVDDSVRANPIYQQLKQQLFDTRTNIETLNTRLNEHKALLKKETERATRVHGGEATMVELSRDYEVNRDIYQDLLRRRENARVSRNLDRDKQELRLRIQEPAFLPVQPSGIRFAHIAMAGLLLSLLAPFGVLYAMTQVDPRIRLESVIATRLKLPVLAVVPHSWSPRETLALSRELQWMGTALTVMVAVLGIFGVLRAVQVL